MVEVKMSLDAEGTKLVSFLQSLRSGDFPISAQQYITAYDLLLTIATRGDWPSDLSDLRDLLAPILCSNPDNQEYFYLQFQRWYDALKHPSALQSNGVITPSRRRNWIRILSTIGLAGALAIIITTIFLGIRKSHIQLTDTPQNTGQVTTNQSGRSPTAGTPNGESTQSSTKGDVQGTKVPQDQHIQTVTWLQKIRQFGPVIIPSLIAAFGLTWLARHWLSRRRAQLARWTTPIEPQPTQLARSIKIFDLYPLRTVQRVATELLRYRSMLKTSLDPERTIVATVKQGGFFTAVEVEHRSTPGYLFLVHRLSSRDQQAALYDLFADRLRAWNVPIETYYYESDPRACRSRERQARTPQYIGIQELAANHFNLPLCIFGDPSHFLSPTTEEPALWTNSLRRWSLSVLFYSHSSSVTRGRIDALSDIGTQVVPAKFEQLTSLPEAPVSNREPKLLTSLDNHYPPLLQRSSTKWVDKKPPTSHAPSELIVQLRDYLGIDGMMCLRACAVYPALFWDFTLYFVETFIILDRRGYLLEKIVTLPWFRHGRMPDWLRMRLLAGLSPEQVKQIRDALERLIESLLEEGPKTKRFEIVRRHFSVHSFTANPAQDYVFVSFMLGYKIDPLNPVISPSLSQTMLQQGHVRSALLILAVTNSVSATWRRATHVVSFLSARLQDGWSVVKDVLHRFKEKLFSELSEALAGLKDRERRRIYHLLIFLVLVVFTIAGRLVWLQVLQHRSFAQQAARQQQRSTTISPVRGIIYDRNGNNLAESVNVDSIFAVPSEIPDVPAVADILGRVLKADAQEIKTRLQASRAFAWVARKVDADLSNRVRSLNLKGIYFQKESKRFYPKRELAAQVLGYVGSDDEGLGGIEHQFDPQLKGKPGIMLLSMDAMQRWFGRVEKNPDPGENIVLTLDEKIQYIVERELDQAIRDTRAEAGTIIVENPRTGEVLALANRPTFNPNRLSVRDKDAIKDRAVNDAYEPGSLFMLVTLSAALEEKLTKPDELIDCQMGSILISSQRIDDHHPYGLLKVQQVLEHSSYVGAIKLALRLGEYRFDHYIRAFGFGSLTGIELPGETQGMTKPLSDWSKTSIGAITMGQEIGVSPLQMISMISTIANDGIYVSPRIIVGTTTPRSTQQLLAFHPPAGTRVISPLTAAEMKTMMQGVVLRGTGTRAILNGYSIAGKTGTAQKFDPTTETYSRSRYLASFGGFAPASNPALTVLVVLDSPVGLHDGGDVAAPVFARVTQQVLEYLNVPHDIEVQAPDRFQLRTNSPDAEK